MAAKNFQGQKPIVTSGGQGCFPWTSGIVEGGQRPPGPRLPGRGTAP